METNFELKNGADAKRVSAGIKHLSLFTGIGGFDLAAEWMGWENIAQVENNEFCLEKLTKNFPNAKRYKDIKEFDGKPYSGLIDILTGGFPCQTFSVAGSGTTDITLWKEMYRTITEIKPPYVVAENVPGIVSRKNGMAFNIVCSDLEAEGYEVQPLNIPIAGKGAPHKRERIWFIAYSDSLWQLQSERREQDKRKWISDSSCYLTHTGSNDGRNLRGQKTNSRTEQTKIIEHCNGNSNTTDTNSNRFKRQRSNRRLGNTKAVKNREASKFIDANYFEESWYEVATRLCRVDDGLPNRVDRIMALGNSISPLLAYDFFRCIEFCISSGAFFNSKFVLDKAV